MMAASKEKKYLEILGLNPGATTDEIKKAYKKLALQCHPDKNLSDPNAKARFQQLSEAYTYFIKSEEEDDGHGYYEDDVVLIELLKFFMALKRGVYPRSSFMNHVASKCECCHGKAHIRKTSDGGLVIDSDVEDDDFSDEECAGSKPYSQRYMDRCNDLEFENEHISATATQASTTSKKKKKNKKKNAQKKDGTIDAKYTDDITAENHKVSSSRATSETKSTENEQNGDVMAEIPLVEPKKKSKKELMAEQRKRAREMAEIAAKIEAQKAQEAEKLKKQEEKERQRREDLSKEKNISLIRRPHSPLDEDVAEEVTEQRLRSDKQNFQQEMMASKDAAAGGETKKSKSRRKREAKQRRRGLKTTQGETQSNGSCFKGDDELGDMDNVGWDEPAKQTTNLHSSFGKPDTRTNQHDIGLKKSEQNTSSGANVKASTHGDSTKDVQKNKADVFLSHRYEPKQVEKKPNQSGGKANHKPKTFVAPRFQRQYEEKMGLAPRFQKDHVATDGRGRHQSAEDNWSTETGEDWGQPKAESHSKPPMWPDSQPNQDMWPDSSNPPWPSSAGSGVTPISLFQPAPVPSTNVWAERQAFFTSALPADDTEEQAMLRAAVELSRLEAEEEECRRKMEEEQAMLLAKAERRRQREEEERKQREQELVRLHMEEKKRKQAELRRQQEEEARRKEEERKRIAEEQRRKHEQEMRRLEEERKRLAEEKRRQEEEDRKRQEEEKKKEEEKRAEEKRRQEEKQRARKEEDHNRRTKEQLIRKLQMDDQIRREEEEQLQTAASSWPHTNGTRPKQAPNFLSMNPFEGSNTQFANPKFPTGGARDEEHDHVSSDEDYPRAAALHVPCAPTVKMRRFGPRGVNASSKKNAGQGEAAPEAPGLITESGEPLYIDSVHDPPKNGGGLWGIGSPFANIGGGDSEEIERWDDGVDIHKELTELHVSDTSEVKEQEEETMTLPARLGPLTPTKLPPPPSTRPTGFGRGGPRKSVSDGTAKAPGMSIKKPPPAPYVPKPTKFQGKKSNSFDEDVDDDRATQKNSRPQLKASPVGAVKPSMQYEEKSTSPPTADPAPAMPTQPKLPSLSELTAYLQMPNPYAPGGAPITYIPMMMQQPGQYGFPPANPATACPGNPPTVPGMSLAATSAATTAPVMGAPLGMGMYPMVAPTAAGDSAPTGNTTPMMATQLGMYPMMYHPMMMPPAYPNPYMTGAPAPVSAASTMMGSAVGDAGFTEADTNKH